MHKFSTDYSDFLAAPSGKAERHWLLLLFFCRMALAFTFNPLRGWLDFGLPNLRIPSAVNHIKASGRSQGSNCGNVPKSKVLRGLKSWCFIANHPLHPITPSWGFRLAAEPRNLCSNPSFPMIHKVQSTGTSSLMRSFIFRVSDPLLAGVISFDYKYSGTLSLMLGWRPIIFFMHA